MKPPEIVAVAFYVAIALFSLYYGMKVIMDEPQLMCGVAEISPDFTAADRARCRLMRRRSL